VQHEREPLGRGQRLEHHQQREPHRVGQYGLLFRVGPVRRAGELLGEVRVEGSSRRDARERSMSSDTRATTVVSQPPRFCTPLASARLSRSQASWTASSASLTEPSIR